MLNIEKGRPEIVDIIAPLFDKYRQFYKQPANKDPAAFFIKERLEKNESVIFLATWNSEPAGFTQLYPIFSSVRMRGHGC